VIIEPEFPRAGLVRSGVLLLAALAFGISGCSNKQTPAEEEQQALADVDAEIQSVVTDPERAAQAIKLIDEMEASLKQLHSDRAQRKENIRMLNQNYDAPRESFEAELAATRAEFSANERRVSLIRQRLTEVLTDEEWATIDKARSKALESSFKTLQTI
jgi:uncharacterized protein HemX